MRLVFLGAPGAGKGTQAERMARRLGCPQVSTGELFRAAIREGTPLGKKVQEVVSSGKLVSDDLTLVVVAERLGKPDCRPGYLLDGFPRNPAQARLLEDLMRKEGTKLDAVLLLSVPESTLVRRLTSRRICRACGAVFNLEQVPPRRAGVCDACGGELYQRDDDREETVRRRLVEYLRQTASLVGYYRDLGVLREVAGDFSVEETEKRLNKLVGQASCKS